MRISWIEQDEHGYLNMITIHNNSIEYDILDRDGNQIIGDEWEISEILSEKLKKLFEGQIKPMVHRYESQIK